MEKQDVFVEEMYNIYNNSQIKDQYLATKAKVKKQNIFLTILYCIIYIMITFYVISAMCKFEFTEWMEFLKNGILLVICIVICKIYL
jgi:uncharacterized membrane protein YhdT